VLPDSIRLALSPVIGAVRRAEPVGGGCSAHASRVEADRGVFFLKWAEGEGGRSFEAEAEGLRALRSVAPEDLLVPAVVAVRNANGAPGYLLLAWVEAGRFDDGGGRRFGRALAALHRAEAPVTGEAGPYGFSGDNVIGRLPQVNPWRADWPAFFRDARLRPQFERARASGRWRTGWEAPAERLLAQLGDLLPSRPHPSPLHGDLWSGNVLAVAGGRAALVDPAAYVGHREADLAMTELFGGFDAAFYDAYRAAWPLEPGYPERREVYNLYHLVNHLNHFGEGYALGVERVLRRWA